MTTGKRNALVLGLMGIIVGGLLGARYAYNPERRKSKYLARGLADLDKGKYAEASILFRQALQVDPHFVEAYYRLGLADLKLHQWRGAFDALGHAAELDPGRADVHLALAQLFLAAREFDQCETEAKLVIQKEPDNAPAYRTLGESLLARHEGTAAMEAFTRLAHLRPADPATYTDLALAEISLKNGAGAEQDFRKSVEVDPHYVEGYLNLARLWESEKKLNEAEQILRQGVQVNLESIPLYLAWARLLAAENKRGEDEAVFDKLRARMPQSAEAAAGIGDFYTEQRQPDRAMTEYKRGLTLESSNIGIKVKLADVDLVTGKIQPASELVEEVLAGAPTDLGARILKARVLTLQGKPEDAILLAQQVVRDAPSSPQAHYVLAMAFVQAGSLGQASGELHEALRYAPNLPIVLEAMARLDLRLGDFHGAQDLAQKIVVLDGNSTAGHSLLGTALARQQQFAAARAEFLIVQKLAPADPAIYLDLSQTFAGERKWPEAERELEEALKLNPRYTPALAQLTALWVSQNHEAKARARVQEYLGKFPDDPTAHYLMGELELKSRNNDQAETEFLRATQLDPAMVSAYVQLGKVQQQRGNSDAAIARYQKALSLQPKSMIINILLGDMFQAKGDLPQAAHYYETALALDSGSAVAANDLAWVYALQNTNLDTALGLAQKAKRLLPEVDSVTDTLGWVYYKKGLYGAAVPLLQECTGKSPSHTVYHYHLGMALLANGDRAKGREQLEAALKSGLAGDDALEAHKALAQPD